MPLNKKGKKIKKALTKQYGKEKGEKVFYAMENSGKVKKVKKLRGGGMDAGNKSNQAKSAAMGKAGVDNQVASATNYSGLGNRSNSTKDALTAQNKGARAAISPSTTTGNRIASAAMNFVLPGSGYLYNKSIDSKAMGYNKSKSKVTVPPVNTGGGNNNSSSTVLPGPIPIIQPMNGIIPIPRIRPTVSPTGVFNYSFRKGGMLRQGKPKLAKKGWK
jgi:hypothetical protein